MPLRDSLAAVLRPGGANLRPISGLRAICILMVMAFHSLFVVHFLYDDAQFIAFMRTAPAWVVPVANGDKAVDAFFVLSGFLLTASLLKRPLRPAGPFLWRFWRGRLFRILPLFYLALLLYGIDAWDGRVPTLVWNLLFVDNIVPGGDAIIPVGWSLAIEMQFCLVLPVLVLWSGRHLVPVALAGAGLALALKAAAVAAEPAFFRTSTLAILASPLSSRFLDTLYYPTWMRFDPLLLGVVAAALRDRHAGRIARHAPALTVAGLVLVGLGLAWPPARQTEVAWPSLNAVLLVLHRPAFALGVAALLLAVLAPARDPVGRAVRRVLEWPFWHSWSEMLYPLYLFHFPMIAVAAALVFGTTDKAAVTAITIPDIAAIFVIGAALSWAFCLPLHLAIERPMHARGRRAPRPGGGPTPATAADRNP